MSKEKKSIKEVRQKERGFLVGLRGEVAGMRGDQTWSRRGNSWENQEPEVLWPGRRNGKRAWGNSAEAKEETCKKSQQKRKCKNVDGGAQTLCGLGAGELGKNVLRREAVVCLGLCRRKTMMIRGKN